MEPIKKSLIERAKQVAGLQYRGAVANLRKLSEDEFWLYQADAFRHIYEDGVKHVPYYRARSIAYPSPLPDAPDVLAMLEGLPVLTKSVVKEDPSQFWRKPPLFMTAEHTTGGTTGTPLRVRAALFERGFTNAILEDRYLDIVGTRSPRILRLSGFLDNSVGEDQILLEIPGTPFAYLSIYKLSKERRSEITKAMEQFQPQVLHGYASALHQLALVFEDAGPPQLKHELAVVSTSETLFPHQRDDIESYLRCRVFNEYGSQEGQHLVLECAHRSLHIHPARGVVEILEMGSDRPAVDGEVGRVIVTGLANRTMPLIRYDLGDSAISTGYRTNCSCGLAWPTIGTVYGRTEDLVRTRDGRRIGLLSHSTLKDWEGIRESQVIQKGYGEFHYFIVPANSHTFDRTGLEQHVRRQLQQRIDEEASVTFHYVDEVPRTSAGKVRAVIVDF